MEVSEAAETFPEVAEKEASEAGVRVASEAVEIFPEVAEKEALEDGVNSTEVEGREVLEVGVKEVSEGVANFHEGGVNSTEVAGKEVSEDEVITPEAVAMEVSEVVTVILLPGDFFWQGCR